MAVFFLISLTIITGGGGQGHQTVMQKAITVRGGGGLAAGRNRNASKLGSQPQRVAAGKQINSTRKQASRGQTAARATCAPIGVCVFTDPVQVTVLGGGVVRTQDGEFSQYWGRRGGGRPVLGRWLEHGERPRPLKTFEKNDSSNSDCLRSHAKRGDLFC